MATKSWFSPERDIQIQRGTVDQRRALADAWGIRFSVVQQRFSYLRSAEFRQSEARRAANDKRHGVDHTLFARPVWFNEDIDRMATVGIAQKMGTTAPRSRATEVMP